MARKPRIDFPGAFHHVMNRGADRQTTFRNDGDRQAFIELWAKASSRFGIEVIAFALMENHYHVFVHSPDGQLSATMQFVARQYTQTFNKVHGRDGALFRGRFHSILVDSDSYFAQVAKYIELNPVKAGICSIDQLDSYPWSTFQYYAGRKRPPIWLATHHLADHFRTPSNYRSFVKESRLDPELDKFYSRPLDPSRVLGNREFVSKITASYPELKDQLAPGIGEVSVDEIELMVASLSGRSLREIIEASRPMDAARQAVIILAHSLTDEPQARLAARYGFSSGQSFSKAARLARLSQSSETHWLLDAVNSTLAQEYR